MRCCCRVKIGGWVYAMVIIVALASVVAFARGQAAQAAVEAVATLFANTATAAGAVALSTANLSLAVTDVAVALSRGGISLFHEAWQGVDLVDACCRAHGVRWIQRVTE